MIAPRPAAVRTITVATLPCGVASAIVWGAATLGAIVLLAAAVLWFHYGTAVFFEMIAAGISACF